MTSKTAQSIIVEPFEKHTATVIWLHGEGEESNVWPEKLGELVEPNHTRLIFPRARNLKLSAHNGLEVPAWFNVFPADYTEQLEDDKGIKRSYDAILRIIQEEIKGTAKSPGIPASRIVLGGFSQGGSMAYYIGINAPMVLGGIICLSGYFIAYKTTVWDEIRKPAIMICQGDSDPVLPVNSLMAVSRVLRNVLNIVFHIYDGVKHETCDQELEDVEKFIKDRIPKIK